MLKHILVPDSGVVSDSVRLETVFDIARPFSAHVEVLHVRRNPRRDLPLYGEGFSPEMLEAVVQEAEKRAEETAVAARRRYDDAVVGAQIRDTRERVEGEGVTAEWREVIGPVARTLAAEARFTDLMVLFRDVGNPVDADVVEAALFESGRPVLLPGGDMTRLDNIAIAWDGGLPAVRAVAAARDFLARAATVTILHMDEGMMDAVETVVSGRRPPHPQRLLDHLAWHGIHATLRRIPREQGPVGAALAATAAELNAGLLVMGGYGHSRLREVVLGGATRYMINTPVDCAVLLAH